MMKLDTKKLMVIILPTLLLAACDKGGSTGAAAEAAKPAAPAAAAAAKPAAAKDSVIELGAIGDDGMPALARKSNCAACHVIEGKKLGPSWMDVARKYKGVATYKFNGKDYPMEEGMFQKVAKGGAGVWGTMPMPANSPAVKDEEIRLLVKFVLGLAK
ncbi:MAG TPA: c-type cytochrome [Gallionellaceae bacterium]